PRQGEPVVRGFSPGADHWRGQPGDGRRVSVALGGHQNDVPAEHERGGGRAGAGRARGHLRGNRRRPAGQGCQHGRYAPGGESGLGGRPPTRCAWPGVVPEVVDHPGLASTDRLSYSRTNVSGGQASCHLWLSSSSTSTPRLPSVGTCSTTTRPWSRTTSSSCG